MFIANPVKFRQVNPQVFTMDFDHRIDSALSSRPRRRSCMDPRTYEVSVERAQDTGAYMVRHRPERIGSTNSTPTTGVSVSSRRIFPTDPRGPNFRTSPSRGTLVLNTMRYLQYHFNVRLAFPLSHGRSPFLNFPVHRHEIVFHTPDTAEPLRVAPPFSAVAYLVELCLSNGNSGLPVGGL